MASNTQEIVKSPRIFNDDALAAITDFDSAMAALSDSGHVAQSVTDFGNGFSVVDDKRRLIGVPFVILEWRFNESEISDKPFVSATIVTDKGDKLILNDGSTGIRDQLTRISEQTGKNAGILVPKGLTESSYTFVDADGKDRPATTFYLSESA